MATELQVKPALHRAPEYVSNEFPLPVRAAGPSASVFGEQIVTERTPIIELNSAYGTSLLRDIETTSNSGAVSGESTGEILLSTGATATSAARVDSAERIRYVPGYSAEFGIGIRIPTAPTGNATAKWGIRAPDGNEGVYFGHDATGLFVAVIRDGTETKIRQADWNTDTLDGNGASGIDLDISEGYIFQCQFSWYGYGPITFGIISKTRGVRGLVVCHEFAPSETTSLQTPNLPIFVEADNGGDAADFDVYLGGRQASIVGRYIPKFRTVGQERTGVSTSTTSKPLVSFRNKTGFEDRSVQLDALTAAVATEDHVIEVYLNPTLTGESWTTPTNATAAETALETDVSATALSGGHADLLHFRKVRPSEQGSGVRQRHRF